MTNSIDWSSKIELENGITKGEMDELIEKISQEVKDKINKS